MLDLSKIECMIALPMHPSLALPINELKADAKTILGEAQDNANAQISGASIDLLSKVDNSGNIIVDQGVIAGCSGGTYGNIMAAANILKGSDVGNSIFRLSVYPDSLPVYQALLKNGALSDILECGAIFRECFCGPCFGAGDTPANGEFSIRHTTRNFPNREGSKPIEGQMTGVALMDARSIAATAKNQGILTAASDICTEFEERFECDFDDSIYRKRVYFGFGNEDPNYELKFGPNIKDWPEQKALSKNLLIKIVSHIDDDVTTTDELIPSGETSSFRSNPLRLAEFTLSRRDPNYVNRAKEVANLDFDSAEISDVVSAVVDKGIAINESNTNICSAIYAKNPGDGSAREQAASCQRVLGGGANFAKSYATKRYRSNCINWGMLPFLTEDGDKIQVGSYVVLVDILFALKDDSQIESYVISQGKCDNVSLSLGNLSDNEKDILRAGCLINYYRS